MCHEHRYTQACNEVSSKENVGKTSCTSSDCEFMRLVYRGDNPKKKTLIDIPYISCHQSSSSYNPSCPIKSIKRKITQNLIKHQQIIILLLFIQLVYLGMCPGASAHIIHL